MPTVRQNLKEIRDTQSRLKSLIKAVIDTIGMTDEIRSAALYGLNSIDTLLRLLQQRTDEQQWQAELRRRKAGLAEDLANCQQMLDSLTRGENRPQLPDDSGLFEAGSSDDFARLF